jgi:hypothetical protein
VVESWGEVIEEIQHEYAAEKQALPRQRGVRQWARRRRERVLILILLGGRESGDGLGLGRVTLGCGRATQLGLRDRSPSKSSKLQRQTATARRPDTSTYIHIHIHIHRRQSTPLQSIHHTHTATSALRNPTHRRSTRPHAHHRDSHHGDGPSQRSQEQCAREPDRGALAHQGSRPVQRRTRNPISRRLHWASGRARGMFGMLHRHARPIH